MKKMAWVFFVLISIILFAVTTFVSVGPTYIGGSYYESGSFQESFDYKIQEIGPVLLSRLDVDEEIKNLQVEPYEVEQYREYYGSQIDQIISVQDQYQELINNADSNGDDVLKTELEKDRDTKIADIRKNFEDDDSVSEKILSAKKEALRKYDAQISNAVSQAKITQKSMAYNLTNVETGESFVFGDIKEEAAYTKIFNQKEGYLTVSSLDQHLSELQNDELQALSIHNVYELVGDESSQFTGTFILPKSMISNDQLVEMRAYEQSNWFFIATCILGLFSAAGAFWLYRTKKKEVLTIPIPNWIKQLKLEWRVVGILVTVFGLLNTYYPLIRSIEGIYYNHLLGEYIVNTGLLFIFMIVFLTLTIVQLIWLLKDYRNNEINKLWENSMSQKLMGMMQEVFLNRSLGTQLVMLLFVVFFAGLGIGGVIVSPALIFVYAPLFVIVVLPVIYNLLKRVANYNKLAIATEQMAQGQLIGDVEIRGKSVFADHAKHLNKLREGVRMSQSEQAKSERLKTELITNVSHDLRTPLTSIITYTDLLKKPELSDEERLSYVSILDRKSQRLKTLIEDLFEVSKMASGNMELHKQKVDLTQLMQQALAEHEEEIQSAKLDFRVTPPTKSLYAYVDGQKWWRVLDNLIGNSIKYTLPGTRVYITLKEQDDCALFIIKNVTRYELGENVDELFERFKRADTSRHTEGSGLGLAISQSIVDLHGGSMRIDVDGDLFKVTVSIQTI
ncbi:sensor histidine kinase KdpD [Paenisporosarcina sp. OV554]|uniref:sensor histidine kinase n=1 Tax=Paenisporosarcina sp. OV554 TaxID=2135694 RepID=UPI000D356EF0|nr:HAMP domain-containing sensor histidine kinase [Paenisporosarcina sp. OV554]PUB16784.1 signal transduction histidine kinase [Paenisporosarcina sp. OV554]